MLISLATLLAPLPPDQAGLGSQIPAAQSEVVIVRGVQPAKAQDGATQLVFNEDALASQAGTRIDDVLRQVPGVGLFRRASSGTANATIQGLSLRPIAPNGAGRALVTLDGVPQNDPFGGWVYWGRYDPIILQSVEVKRGAAGAGLGPMALTGALALRQSERPREPLVYADLAAPQAYKVAFRDGLEMGAGHFEFVGGYEHSRGVYGVSDAQRGPVDTLLGFRFGNAGVSANIAQPNGKLVARLSVFEERKSGGLEGAYSDARGLDVSVTRQLELRTGQFNLAMFAQGRDFANRAESANVTRTLATPTLDQFATPTSALGGSINWAPNSNFPRLQLDWRTAEGETRELFRYIGTDFTRKRLAGGQQDLVGFSVVPQEPIRLGEGPLSFDGVLRVDHWANKNARRLETDRTTGLITLDESPADTSGEMVSGRASLDLNDGLLRISAYRTFRPPTLNELHRPFRVGNDVTEANSGLVPETLDGVDVDIATRSTQFGLMWTSGLTLFVNRLNDPIANVTIGTGPGTFARIGFLPAGGSARQRRNIGHIHVYGLEGQFNWQAQSGTVGGYAAFSWVHARVNGAALLANLTGKRPAQAPEWSLASGFTWRASQKVQMNLTLRGEGDRFEDDLNTRKLAAFGSIDAGLEYQLTEKTRLFVSIDNMLDRPVQSGKSGDGIIALAQRRVLRLGLTYTR
jgi:outer membrane cobalamin receptor